MDMTLRENLYKETLSALKEQYFLREMGFSRSELELFLKKERWNDLLDVIFEDADSRGRFNSKKVVEVLKPVLDGLCPEPENGWLQYTYNYVLGQIFPEKKADVDDEVYAKGRAFLLQALRGLYRYERENLAFDPTLDMNFLKPAEVDEKGYLEEYKRLIKMTRSHFVYEFMRIGIDITPFNTLGHISGVHYVAMHVARQLEHLNIPIDLGLVSGAAAGHDIGKYGCKKGEERRIPYLHYYYTDICFDRFGMPMIGHIAANHSTWDLELENLSVESLILIYSDFRVKSSRDETGWEVVHFYSLADAFDVILNKLDNVDAAKELRYRKVYNKLKDFEDYMISLGVEVNLPEVPQPVADTPVAVEKKDPALLRSGDIVPELKYEAIGHNIVLMNKFSHEGNFGNLLEAARSEKNWKQLRTYLLIFGRYSTYMTEKQKMMTLRFLYELFAHKESDIRKQAGELCGQIIAKFNAEYRKELPAGVILPKKKITNISIWEKMVAATLNPGYKVTEQHRQWIGGSLECIIAPLLDNATPELRYECIEVLMKWYKKTSLTMQNKEDLLDVARSINPEYCTEAQVNCIVKFADKVMKDNDMGLSMSCITVRKHLGADSEEEQFEKVKQLLGIQTGRRLTQEDLSEIYLDNLKARTSWTVKVANIRVLLKFLESNPQSHEELHVATHLGNLVKVSETVTVRQAAGEGLIKVIEKMPLEQRNEIAVELGKGLEIGDYQFSKYIPDYLGVIMLHLPPGELDELICDLEKFLDETNGQVAAAVLHTFGVCLENYSIYRKNFGHVETEETTEVRKYKLINLIIRGFANYNDVISQEALWTIGNNIFNSQKLTVDEKFEFLCHCGKKVMTIYNDLKENELDFFNNSAAFSYIYQFICQYEIEVGQFDIPEMKKVAFFPGTFDPFSIGHKAIATQIRDLGFEVYLALDEFSWSKKTQPRLHRRRIMTMSVADEQNIYIMPEDIPVNIANPKDMKNLKELFGDREVYFAAGSDVVENASCYRTAPADYSIHSFNHIIFKRVINGRSSKLALPDRYDETKDTKLPVLTGEVINLELKGDFDDVSSTRIRENIDLNRDISNLIDPVAQNYIYENNLYLREPEFKHVLQARDIRLGEYQRRAGYIVDDLSDELERNGYDVDKIRSYIDREDVDTLVIRDGMKDNDVVAVAAVNRLESIDLLKEFGSQEIAAYIRDQAAGSIAVIGGIYLSQKTSIDNLGQILLTEVLAELLAKDYTYAVYHPCDEAGMNGRVCDVLNRQGFVNIAEKGEKEILAVNMKSPVIIFKNVETVIKSPLNKNPRVLRAVEDAHNRLLKELRTIYPGQLIMSFNAGILHHKVINLITKINGVQNVPTKEKKNGPYMAVSFGKILEGVAVPNTVTKELHTEKYFNSDVSAFTIEENSFYSPLDYQIKVIKSFNRPVILVHDLVHKGYRMKKISPLLKKNDVRVVDTVVGVQTGRGRDLMTIKNRSVLSAYFLPNLKCWIDETTTYPYIGGDCLKNPEVSVASQGTIPALNMILPFTIPTFLIGASSRNIYDFSMACLENSRDILKTLEEEYQKEFERKLTLKRLGEVVSRPKRPDLGSYARYDEKVPASFYAEKDIEKLQRLKRIFL